MIKIKYLFIWFYLLITTRQIFVKLLLNYESEFSFRILAYNCNTLFTKIHCK